MKGLVEIVTVEEEEVRAERERKRVGGKIQDRQASLDVAAGGAAFRVVFEEQPAGTVAQGEQPLRAAVEIPPEPVTLDRHRSTHPPPGVRHFMPSS